MTPARAGLGTASVGGKIYAVGGRLGDTPGAGVALSAFEVFDPTAAAGLQWAGLPALPVALMDVEATIGLDAATSGTAAGAILVFGGRTAAPGTEVATTYLFDIALGAWSAKAAMPTARGNGMAGLISLGSPFDGKVAVFGGFAGGPNLSVTELYDPLTDTWSAGPAMAVAVSEMAVGPTWDGSGIYSVGSGPFGIAGMVVQRLVVVDVPEPGTALLLALGLLGGLAPQLRRRARI
jgi:hypothetical protein